MFRLPDELLAEIFTFCTIYCADAPVLLGTVCHHFLDVLKRSPSVWTRLYIALHPQQERQNVCKTLQWLKMSGIVPISVCIDANRQSASDLEGLRDSQSMLFAVLKRYTSRIASMDIRCKDGNVVHSIVDAIYMSGVESSVVLHTLGIQSASGFASNPPAAHSSFTAENQASIALLQPHNLYLVNFLPILPFPVPDRHVYAALKTLTILRPLRAAPVAPSQLLRILSSAPQLRNVEIETRIIAPTSSVAKPFLLEDATLAPSLQNLSLRTNNISLVLGPLRTPALRSLRLNDLNGRGPRSAEKLSGALLQVLSSIDYGSGCGLNMLELFGANLHFDSRTEWEECIACMSRLGHLVMINMDGTEIFQKLSLAEAQILPSLRKITFQGTVDPAALTRAQNNRPGVELRFVHDGKGEEHADIAKSATSSAGIWAESWDSASIPQTAGSAAKYALLDHYGIL
jgi:hypothetical protein